VNRCQRRRWHGREKRLHAALKVEILITLLDDRAVRKAIGELERPWARFDAPQLKNNPHR
jgi:hypothetical protein